MNKYLTNKTRLFFIQYPIVERSHKETSTLFACFVTPSAFDADALPTGGMSLSESEYHS